MGCITARDILKVSVATNWPTAARRYFACKSICSGWLTPGRFSGFPLPYSVEQMCQATMAVIRANKLKACYIRPLAFLGLGELGIYAPNNPVNVCIAVWPWGAYLGDEGIENGIRAKVSSFTRHHVNVTDDQEQELRRITSIRCSPKLK